MTANQMQKMVGPALVVLVGVGLIVVAMLVPSRKQPAPAPSPADTIPVQPVVEAQPSDVSGPPPPVIALSTPLFEAITRRDPAAVRAALASGEDPGKPFTGASAERLGMTPLMAAAKEADYETIAVLLEAGADPEAQGPAGATALMYAAAWNTSNAIKALLDAGADLDARDAAGQTSLLLALQHRQGGNAARLIEAGASVDAADAQGVTPLMLAAEIGRADLVVLLLNAGAAPDLTDLQGRTAHDRAVLKADNRSREIAAMLEEAVSG